MQHKIFADALRPVAFGAALALVAGIVSAQAQDFQDRTIRVSNGVSEDHPNGDGERKMAACALEKSGGKMKIRLVLERHAGQ